jgi:hypothetical protein
VDGGYGLEIGVLHQGHGANAASVPNTMRMEARVCGVSSWSTS